MLLSNMHILITGGTGLVGSALLATVPIDQEYIQCTSLGSTQADLRDYTTSYEYIKHLHTHSPIDAIFHCAAKVGGLYRNINEPVDMINDNVLINTNILTIAHRLNIDKVVCVLSTFIFPDNTQYPIKPSSLHDGPPHSSNEGYAYAKRLLEVQCRAYQKQFKRMYFCIVPTNVYGPNDNFHPTDSHVIPALIRKAVIASRTDQVLKVLGDGEQYRQFIYSHDLASIMWWAMFNYANYSIPLVCCPGKEVQIKQVVETIARYLNLQIEYVTAETGQARKTCMSTNDQLQSQGYAQQFAFKELEEGLTDTIEWYKKSLLG